MSVYHGYNKIFEHVHFIMEKYLTVLENDSSRKADPINLASGEDFMLDSIAVMESAMRVHLPARQVQRSQKWPVLLFYNKPLS